MSGQRDRPEAARGRTRDLRNSQWISAALVTLSGLMLAVQAVPEGNLSFPKLRNANCCKRDRAVFKDDVEIGVPEPARDYRRGTFDVRLHLRTMIQTTR